MGVRDDLEDGLGDLYDADLWGEDTVTLDIGTASGDAAGCFRRTELDREQTQDGSQDGLRASFRALVTALPAGLQSITRDAWMGARATDEDGDVWTVERADVRHGRVKLDLVRSLYEERTRPDYRRTT